MPLRKSTRADAENLRGSRRIGATRTPTWALLAALCFSVLPGCRDRDRLVQVELGDAGTQGEPADAANPPSQSADAASSADAGATPNVSSFDTLFQTLLADVQTQPSERQPFIRYVGLSQRRLAGATEADLDIERAALSLALNSLSLTTTLASPVAIDAQATLYRIDLRDYAWDRELELTETTSGTPTPAPSPDAGVTHSDAWAAISANNPYAVQLMGSAADELVRLTQTPVPFAEAESLLHTALNGDVYYALTGVPSTLEAALTAWGLSLDDVFGGADHTRAANTSGVHIPEDYELIVARYDMLDARLPLWLTLPFDSRGSSTIFENPLEVDRPSENLAAFSLPNGLLGYAIYAPDGQARAASEVTPEHQTASSCFGCHAQGPIHVEDVLRDVYERNVVNFGVSMEELAEVLATYPPQAELDALFTREQAAYRARLTQLGIPNALGADVISTTLARFERPLDRPHAAAELGVSPEQLTASISLLSPELAGLANGLEVPRSDFSRLYEVSLCALYTQAPDQRPAPATCERR
jgi:hypothetical protein